MPQSYATYSVSGHVVSPRKYDGPQVTARGHGLPERVNLTDQCTPVEDQGALGSCVANSFVSALEYSMIKSGLPATDLSRLFVYYNARKLSGNEGVDSGLIDHHAVAAIIAHGVCPEAAWPYDTSRFTQAPPQQCYEMASMFDVMQFARVPDHNTMKATLAAGVPVSCGVDLPSRWLQVEAAVSGKIEASALQSMHGDLAGHTMLAVGYDDVLGAYLFRNSWGTGWGINGHAWIDYQVVEACCHPRFRWAIGQIAIMPNLAIGGHADLTQMACEVRKHAHEDMATALAARKREIGTELNDKLAAETAGFRSRLRASSTDRSSLIGRGADGPGAGGGYDPRKGPGAGGGYGPNDGPGAGGGYGPSDGPGAGGGYED